MPDVVISISSAGDNVIVAGVAAQRIYITMLVIVMGAAVDVTFQTNAVALTGAMEMRANGSIVLDPVSDREARWYETELGEDFRINLSGAVSCRGSLRYELAP